MASPNRLIDTSSMADTLRQVALNPDAPQSSEEPDKHSTDSMIPVVYRELRQLAARNLVNEPSGQTLSATALVHEAYLQLAKSGEPQWKNSGHFYVVAGKCMRRILINRARGKNTTKRGSGVKPVPLPEDSIHAPMVPSKDQELLDLDEALQKLEAIDPRKGQLVSLRYFVGLSIDEAAELLDISIATANRDWAYARAWLHRELTRDA